MRYNFALADADLGIADDPEIGGESRVKLSHEQVGYIGEIAQPAPDSGIYTASTPANVFPAAGSDLVVVAKVGARSASAISLTLDVTFADNTTGTATATYAVPAVAKDRTHHLPIGLAVDLIGDGGDSAKKIKAVTGVNALSGGVAGNSFLLLSLPDTADWFDLGCARDKSETLPVPKALSIPCGLNASAFTKLGRGDVGKITLKSLSFTYGDGLTRLNGHKGSALVEVYKAGRVLTERHFYGDVVFAANTARGDGNDEVMVTAEGEFATFAKFV